MMHFKQDTSVTVLKRPTYSARESVRRNPMWRLHTPRPGPAFGRLTDLRTSPIHLLISPLFTSFRPRIDPLGESGIPRIPSRCLGRVWGMAWQRMVGCPIGSVMSFGYKGLVFPRCSVLPSTLTSYYSFTIDLTCLTLRPPYIPSSTVGLPFGLHTALLSADHQCPLLSPHHSRQ